MYELKKKIGQSDPSEPEKVRVYGNFGNYHGFINVVKEKRYIFPDFYPKNMYLIYSENFGYGTIKQRFYNHEKLVNYFINSDMFPDSIKLLSSIFLLLI